MAYRVRDLRNDVFVSAALKRAQRQIVSVATTPGTIAALVGESGSGKTVAVQHARRMVEWEKCVFTDIDMPAKEELTIGPIITQLVREGDATVTGGLVSRDMTVRVEQLRGLLGSRADLGLNSVLVIDEAHALQRFTLRALKRLLELRSGDRIGLCSVILIGQPELIPLLRTVPEINLRATKIEMGLLARQEAVDYSSWVAKAEGLTISNEAAGAFGAELRNPLKLANVVSALADDCRWAGQKCITIEMATKTLSIPTLRVMRESGITVRRLAQAEGVSASVVSDVLNRKYAGRPEMAERVNRRLEQMVGDKGVSLVERE